MKIAVIGGASTYTPELIDGFIARAGRLPVKQIWLMDPNEERLQIVGGFARRMVKHANVPIQVELTTDRRRAIDGADFVLTQLRIGGQAARQSDEHLGRRHGLVGQETTGVGGFAKALRTVPVVLDIAREMRELAPNATLVNFTNPAGIVTEALMRHGGVPVVGLCNNAITTQRWIAKIFNLAPDQVQIEQVGLNHLNWVRHILIDGKDATEQVLAEYIERMKRNESHVHFPAALISALHAIPSLYLEYFYLESEVLERQARGVPTRAEVVMDVERRLLERYSDPHLCEKPPELMERGGAYYSEAAAALIESLWSADSGIHIINTRNNGAIPNISDDVVVELPCRIGKHGPEPLPVEPLSTPMHGLVAPVKDYELLTIKAATTGDEEAAMLALLANPLGPDATTVESVWADLKRTNAGLLPSFDQAH